jgi:hypothetical protein
MFLSKDSKHPLMNKGGTFQNTIKAMVDHD